MDWHTEKFKTMITFILVSTKQLPTKWAEYPTPLLVLKLKYILVLILKYELLVQSMYVDISLQELTSINRVSPSQY